MQDMRFFFDTQYYMTEMKTINRKIINFNDRDLQNSNSNFFSYLLFQVNGECRRKAFIISIRIKDKGNQKKMRCH